MAAAAVPATPAPPAPPPALPKAALPPPPPPAARALAAPLESLHPSWVAARARASVLAAGPATGKKTVFEDSD